MPDPSSLPPPLKRSRWLRYLAWFGVSQAVTLCVFLSAARSSGAAALQDSGLGVLNQLGPIVLGPPTVAHINGQRMWLVSKFTPLPVSEVLARFERGCHENSGDLGEEVRRLPEARALDRLPAELRDPSTWLTSKQVQGDGNAGQVVCLVRHDRIGGLSGLVGRITQFFDSGDLGVLGDAHYVVARRDAASGETHVLAIWTNGAFNIPALFGADEDAPGSDSLNVARPLESRRVLSADIDGQPYALRMYDTARSSARVLQDYSDELPKRGWSEQVLPRGEDGEDPNQHFRAYSNGSNATIVVVEDTPAGQTGVTLIEMGGRGFVHATARGEQP